MPTSPDRKQRRRRALSADEIVGVALRLARTEGVEAVSMRRIGEELGASPMAVYRHVQDREDLLIRMLGVLADRIGPPVTEGPPRERIARLMQPSTRGSARIRGSSASSPTTVWPARASSPSSRRSSGALADAGFDPTASRATYNLLFQFLYGEALMSPFDRLSTYTGRLPHARHRRRDREPGRRGCSTGSSAAMSRTPSRLRQI